MFKGCNLPFFALKSLLILNFASFVFRTPLYRMQSSFGFGVLLKQCLPASSGQGMGDLLITSFKIGCPKKLSCLKHPSLDGWY